MEQLSDNEIVQQILNGEGRKFEAIMRRYNQRMYRIGMSILGDPAEAEDAMQNAYINAYQHLGQFAFRASFATWMTRIMLNQCFEQKRKRQLMHTEPEPLDNIVNMNTPANVLVNKELSQALETAIAQLPEKYRLVFVLREIEALSVKETSSVLQIEEPNVKVRLNRAKSMLRDNLNHFMKDNVYHFHLTRCDIIVNKVFAQLSLV